MVFQIPDVKTASIKSCFLWSFCCCLLWLGFY